MGFFGSSNRVMDFGWLENQAWEDLEVVVVVVVALWLHGTCKKTRLGYGVRDGHSISWYIGAKYVKRGEEGSLDLECV